MLSAPPLLAAVVVSLRPVLLADWLPAASKAATWNLYRVLGARPVAVNDAVGDVPTSTPSRKMRYPVTPTLSVDAAQVNPAAVSVTDPATTTGLPGTVGLAVSVGGAVMVTEAGVESADCWPIASTARTVYVTVPVPGDGSV